MKSVKSPTFVDYLSVIFRRRALIYRLILSATGSAIIISLCIPNQYTPATTLLPPNPQQDLIYGFVNPTIMSSLAGTSGLTTLLAGGSRPADLFAAILGSDRIKGTLIRKHSLRKVFKTKTFHDASKQLDEITKIGVTPEGLITVSVTWYDKYLATDLANSYIEELDKFNTETAMTTGKKYRIFIEERLKENQDSLALAEKNLGEFQEQHKTVALDVEIQTAIETIAKLKGEIIFREVQRGALASASSIENPYLRSITQELKELRKQLAAIEFGEPGKSKDGFGAGFSVPFIDLPELALEYARLLRNLKVQETIYELLVQQYEQAKIMEVKDTPSVQVLVKASPPEKKSTPKRSRIVILTAFASLVLSIAGVFVIESIEKMKANPERYNKWFHIWQKIRSDAQTLKNSISKVLTRRTS